MAFASAASSINTSNLASAGQVETIVPTTGQTKTISDTTNLYIMNPAGTLATLTVVMPTNPYDKQIITIATSQIITALTLNAGAGQTILNVPTTLAAGGFCSYVYILANTKWYRLS
jgi:hypothetical protein